MSNHTLMLRQLLDSKGVSVRVIVDRKTAVDADVVLAERWRNKAGSIVLQHAIGSNLAQHLIDCELPVMVNYHNITPAHYIELWDSELAVGLRWGRDQLHELASLSRIAVAVSEYNAVELRDAGFSDVAVCPILWESGPEAQSKSFNVGNGGETVKTILSVGRVAPNKCHHDLVAALALLRSVRNDCRLVIVGVVATARYQHAIERFANKLGVQDCITFAGKVSQSELDARYQSADVLVCVSDHEGFGVPLIEAMSRGLPVVAYDAAAVGETIGNGGILLKDKRPATLATAIQSLLDNASLREAIRRSGFEAVRRYNRQAAEDAIWDVLKDYVLTK